VIKGKGAASALLASSLDDEDETEDSESEYDDTESKKAAGEALAKAIESGDGLAIANAFADLKECC
jgi:hypothetical protein